MAIVEKMPMKIMTKTQHMVAITHDLVMTKKTRCNMWLMQYMHWLQSLVLSAILAQHVMTMIITVMVAINLNLMIYI